MTTLKVEKVSDKGSQEFNEDTMLATEKMFVVFDGVTSLSGFKTREGKTGGLVAAEIAKQTFAENGRRIEEIFTKANRRIADAMESEGVNMEKKKELWATTVAGVRLFEKEAEVFGISDSVVLFIDQNDNYIFPFDLEDHDRSILEVWSKLIAQNVKNIREKIDPLIVRGRKKWNVVYGVLNGEEASLQFLKRKRVSLEGVTSILIFTDGFLIPKEDAASVHDWKLFVKLYQEKGLQGLLDYVRNIENEDPDCKKYPRYKKHDDATAIAITL